MADAVLDALKAGDVLARLAHLEKQMKQVREQIKADDAPPARVVPRPAAKTTAR